MSKTKNVVALLVLLCVPVMMFADFREHMDRIEFGVSAGVGFYVGQRNPLDKSELLRIQAYDAVGFGSKSTLKWPGIETFGFQVGYRFDTHWHLKVQATRQRVCFAEYDYLTDANANTLQVRNVYYNPMWHVDVMAEYNLLNYGNIMMPKQRMYNVTPYVGLGIGVTMFNKYATLRAVNPHPENTGDVNYAKMNTFYPQVGKKYEGMKSSITPTGNNEVAVGLYIPVAFGVKWRINDNVQLKGTFQYQLYFSNKGKGGLNSNLEGATRVDYLNGSKHYAFQSAANRPEFDDLTKHIVGQNHDCLFSISAIFNLGKWYEDRLITY